ncbi:MAG TPA: DUF6265 family protein [Candidatus Kapabacteria bacterium]|nr:DUF6265 family protein [Candidatus Kapabacteria bacterium]
MRITSLILVACLFVACRGKIETVHETVTQDTPITDPMPHTIETIAWLEGRWISSDGQGQFIEEWSRSGGEMKGQGKMVKGQDTTNMERLRILFDSTLRYVVNFPNREVQFYLKTTTHTESRQGFSYDESLALTFVNDTNDFPSQITYRRQNSDSLYITLTGQEAGKPMDMTFRMKKQ